jgi:LacI family transcriptional regulator
LTILRTSWHRLIKTKKRLRLVSLLPEATEENAFWLKHPLGLKRAIEELEPFPVQLSQVTFDLLNEKNFQVKSGNVLNLHPDGVILAPIFKTESIDFCNRLAKRHIPFVFLDSCLNETRLNQSIE